MKFCDLIDGSTKNLIHVMGIEKVSVCSQAVYQLLLPPWITIEEVLRQITINCGRKESSLKSRLDRQA